MDTKQVALAKTELLNMEIVLPVIAFVIPLTVSGPQWLTGAVVNTLLFLYAAKSSNKNLLLISIIPSIGALSHGVLFGKFTFFLLYFLPFIWVGNIVMMKSFTKLKKFMPIAIAVILSSSFKTMVIYLSAFIYYRLHIVPQLFLTSMGVIQFYTAIFGGILALTIIKLINFKNE